MDDRDTPPVERLPEGLRLLAAITADYYHTLRKSNVPAETAERLTLAMTEAVMPPSFTASIRSEVPIVADVADEVLKRVREQLYRRR